MSQQVVEHPKLLKEGFSISIFPFAWPSIHFPFIQDRLSNLMSMNSGDGGGQLLHIYSANGMWICPVSGICVHLIFPSSGIESQMGWFEPSLVALLWEISLYLLGLLSGRPPTLRAAIGVFPSMGRGPSKEQSQCARKKI